MTNSIIRVILFVFACIGSIFTLSYRFIDAELLPKWFVTSGVILFWVGYQAVRFLFYPLGVANKDSRMQPVGIGIIILVTFGQSLYGLLQFFKVLPPITSFPVTGSYENPAGFATSLCVGFPFLIYAFVKSKGLWRWLIGFLAGMVVFAVNLSASRASILSLAAVSLFWGMQYVKLHKVVKIIFLPVLFAGLVAGLYFYKKDSADGRLLIWQCSLEMVKDKPLFGYGFGGFAAHYMDYQAEYFKKYPDSVYSALADTVQEPFNEYINIWVAYGLIGMLLLIVGMSYLVRSYLKHPILENRLAISVWLSIGVVALFSYPLMYPFVWMMLLYSTCLLTYKPIHEIFKGLSRFRFAIGSAIICVVMYMSFLLNERIRAELAWKDALNIFILAEKESAFRIYKDIYRYLKKDRFFLYNYSSALSQTGRNEESLFIALQCREYWADYDLELLLGELYERLDQPIQATQHYKYASLMCPNRFMPLYKLVLLLKEEGQLEEAMQLAQDIVNKSEKVPSVTTQRIKREMRELIFKERSKSDQQLDFY